MTSSPTRLRSRSNLERSTRMVCATVSRDASAPFSGSFATIAGATTGGAATGAAAAGGATAVGPAAGAISGAADVEVSRAISTHESGATKSKQSVIAASSTVPGTDKVQTR